MKPSHHKEWYWGHPEAEPIDSKEWAPEKTEVSKIVRMNHENSLIQKAVGSIDEWLKEAFEARYYLYKRLLGRLWDIGIRGSDILIEASAISLYRVRNPNMFLSDRHFSHVLGNKIIRIVPYWGATKGYEHYGIGMSVQKRLGATDIGIAKAVIQGKENARKIKQSMGQPLDI